MPRIIVLLFIILSLALPAHAESRYVTDQVLVSLRPAADDTSPPLERLATGMRVEVMEDLGAFLKIKSSAGSIGFVRSKYFIPTPPAGATGLTPALQEQLARTTKENAELSAELQQMKTASPTTDHAALVLEREKNRSELAELNKRYQELEKNLGGGTAIIQERDLLKQEVARLSVASKNPPPATPERSPLQWFLAGGAVLLAGWIAGKSSRPKRHF